MRHVAQGVGPRGRQGLGGPARHGAQRSGPAAAASPAPQRPGPTRPEALHQPLGAAAARCFSWPQGWAFPRVTPQLRALSRHDPRHLRPRAQQAAPRRPRLAAPPPRSLARREGRGGAQGAGLQEGGVPSRPAHLPAGSAPTGSCAAGWKAKGLGRHPP